jgi:mono/diheme cytochrome c family protein
MSKQTSRLSTEWFLVALLAFTFMATLATASCRSPNGTSRTAPDPSPNGTESSSHYDVTPVKGQSWLHHLGVSLPATRMGKMGGEAAAPHPGEREPAPSRGGDLGAVMDRFLGSWLGGRPGADEILHETFHLTGADLYRLNCQACHGPSGEGAPPEINSLLDPVRGASAAALMARMKARGTPIDQSMADELAAQAEQTLRQRLEQGGEKMPAFPHLRGDEVEALMTYLRHLAGVPPSPHDVASVSESAARVGEHVIKGTCHTCHDATGPGGGHMAMMRGVVPSLASLPRELTLSAVVRQVQFGSSPMMRGMMGRGMGGMMGGGMSGSGSSPGLMPAFPYFTEPEITAAYFYLAQYPPAP